MYILVMCCELKKLNQGGKNISPLFLTGTVCRQAVQQPMGAGRDPTKFSLFN